MILNEGWPHPDAPDIKQKYGEFLPLSNEGSWNVMNVGSNTCVRVSGGDRWYFDKLKLNSISEYLHCRFLESQASCTMGNTCIGLHSIRAAGSQKRSSGGVASCFNHGREAQGV